jgi:hypothetical protein
MQKARFGGAFASAAPAFGGGTIGRQSGQFASHSTNLNSEPYPHDSYYL